MAGGLDALRRELLLGIQDALLEDPANVATPTDVLGRRLRQIRDRTSVRVGLLIAILYEGGFPENDRLNSIQRRLAEGSTVGAEDLDWLDGEVGQPSPIPVHR